MGDGFIIDAAGSGIKSGFGRMDTPSSRTKHAYGMDLSYDSWGSAGDPIKNIAGGGTVVSVQRSNKGVGNSVLIDYGGRQVRYNHLQDFTVKPGQKIAAGAVIGRMGSSGNSPSGAHISYEFRKGNKVVPANVAFSDAKFSSKWGNKAGSWSSATEFDLSSKKSSGSRTGAFTTGASAPTAMGGFAQPSTGNIVSKIF